MTYSRSETHVLLRRYHREGDDHARTELVERMLPLAHSLARRYANRGEPLDDLEQVASIGLLKAIDRFDCERDVRFTTFAVPTIAGELKRHFRDKAWTLRVPREIQELSAQLKRARERIARETGRSPTVTELARAADTGVEQALEALNAAGTYRMASLDDAVGDGPGTVEGLASQDAGFERCEQRLMLRGGFQAIEAREREILRLRFFEGLTQREIAARMGISQMHVSRLIRRSLIAVRSRLRADPVAQAA